MSPGTVHLTSCWPLHKRDRSANATPLHPHTRVLARLQVLCLRRWKNPSRASESKADVPCGSLYSRLLPTSILPLLSLPACLPSPSNAPSSQDAWLTCMCTCVCVHNACVCSVYMCVHRCTYMCVPLCVHMCTVDCVHTVCTCVYVIPCTCMCVCMRTYMHSVCYPLQTRVGIMSYTVGTIKTSLLPIGKEHSLRAPAAGPVALQPKHDKAQPTTVLLL